MSDPEATSGARYRVGDVCRIADVQPYVLRYWETEFPVLGPGKQGSGPRLYTENDLRVIRRIKQLLYDEGYTIAGAKKRLDSESKGLATAPAPARGETGEDGGAGEAEPPLLVPPPLPAPAPIPKPRRARPKPPKEEGAQELVFEETSLEPPEEKPREDARDAALSEPPADSEAAEPEPAPEQTEEPEAPEAGRSAAAAPPALPAWEEPAPAPRSRSKARPKPEPERKPEREPEITAIELASLVEPPPSFPDPRLSIAIAELKDILALLSRDPE